MEPISFTALVFIAAFVTAKVITNYRIDREYARQGLDSPRMRMKLAKQARGEASPAAVARTRPGASGYFRELWDDAWEDAVGRHREVRAARKTGHPLPPRQRLRAFGRWLASPVGDRDEPAPAPETADRQEPKAPPTDPADRPTVPVTRPAPPAARPAPPVVVTGTPRIPCPRGCGGRITDFRINQLRPGAGEDQHCSICGWLTDHAAPKPTTEGAPMATTTATGDVHDVETCDQQLDALADDLSAIDAALDVIDSAIRDAGNATELIEAFLRSKNVDDTTVGGMSTAREMLSPDRIKELIDAIAAAKQGVAATKDGLGLLREAGQLVGAADGSVLNGR